MSIRSVVRLSSFRPELHPSLPKRRIGGFRCASSEAREPRTTAVRDESTEKQLTIALDLWRDQFHDARKQSNFMLVGVLSLGFSMGTILYNKIDQAIDKSERTQMAAIEKSERTQMAAIEKIENQIKDLGKRGWFS